ncbi:MAG: alpha/beta fold hydrolase [Emcibacter sp.]|nr:alpha/beta fold hydrolase [Emcibacter sp.]
MFPTKNKAGFQKFGRDVPGLQVPDFHAGLKWRGADLQTLRNTIVGPAMALTPGFQRVSFDMGTGQSLQAAFHPSSKSGRLPLIIIIHGMSGDEKSPNVVSSAAHFCSLGFPVLRLNLRGAGPSAETSVGPYHGGLSEDLARVVDQVLCRDYGAGVVLYGISLGGNMMLKYLGERGAEAPIKAAIAVSAPLCLKAVQCRIMASRNRLYHNYLLLGMKKYAKQMTGQHDEALIEKAQAANLYLNMMINLRLRRTVWRAQTNIIGSIQRQILLIG